MTTATYLNGDCKASNWTYAHESIITANNFNGDHNGTLERTDASLDLTSNMSMNRTVGDNNITVSRFPDQTANWTMELKNKEDEAIMIQKTIENTSEVIPSSQLKAAKKSETSDDDADMYNFDEMDQDELFDDHKPIIGNIMHVKSLENFYFQAQDADVQLMDMKSKLDEACKNFDKLPPEGTICVCKSKYDQQMYRAQLIDNKDINQLKVMYIDYGNEDCVNITQLFKIDNETKIIPPLAINCSLYFTNKCNDIFNKLKANAKLNDAGSTHATNTLIKCFKNLTGNSKVMIKVRKQMMSPDMMNRSTKMLVDLFLLPNEGINIDEMYSSFYKKVTNLFELKLISIRVLQLKLLNLLNIYLNFNQISFKCTTLNDTTIGSEANNSPKNVLDSLLLEVIFFLTQTETATNPISNQIKKREFDGYLVNLHSFDTKKEGMNLQLNIQNSVLTNLMRTLIGIFHSSKAPIVGSFESFQKTQTDNFYLTELPALVSSHFGCSSERVLARVCVLNQPTTSTVRVKFIDYGYETVLERSRLFKVSKYLMKIFKLLPSTLETTYNLHLDVNTNLLPQAHYEHLYEIFKLLVNCEQIEGFTLSSKLKCVFSPKKQVRLYDSNCEQLDINRVIEMSVLAMMKPYTGFVTHMSEDYKQFDFLHELAKKQGTISELEKIFRSTDLFKSETGSDSLVSFLPGQLCIVNLTRAEQMNDGASILMLSEHVINETIQPAPVKQELFRAIVLDQSDDLQKVIVFNVDTGKQMTVNSNRVTLIQDKNKYCLLARIVPFMMIKAKLEANFDDENVQRAIYNSKYYGNKIQVKVVGSWTPKKRNATNELPPPSQINGEFKCEKFAQTEKDLFRLVELLNLGIN
jgi:hypothetical protein